MSHALMRAISPRMSECELTYLDRAPIDAELADRQHRAFQERLREMGFTVIVIPPDPSLQDAAFIEDTAVVLDEIAVITRPGAVSRRPEIPAVAEVLSRYRPLKQIKEPATLEGGDAMRVGRRLYVGVSTRTNQAGIAQLQELIAPYDYQVIPVPVTGCLHLKTGGTWLGDETWLVNREWIDVNPLKDFRLLDVPAEEPWAANTLVLQGTLFLPAGFPLTREMLEKQGYQVATVEMSELQKAEAGLTCMSVIFQA